MSLLMDALKKAEKEKKEAAKRRQTGQHPILTTGEHPVDQDDTQLLDTTSTQSNIQHDDELTQEVSMELQPKGDDITFGGDTTSSSTYTDTQIIDDTQIMDTDDDTILTIGGEDIELDLEDTQLIGEMTDETIIGRTMEQGVGDATTHDASQTMGSDDTGEFPDEVTDELRTSLAEDNLDDETLGLKLETLENDRELADITAEQQPTKETPAESEKPKYRTNLGQITDPSIELEAMDSVSVTQMLRDIGNHEGLPTPAAASTVFAASKTDNWGSKVGLGLLSALVLLLIVTGGLFIHYQTTPDVPQVVSPTVAKGVEASKSSTISSLSELTEQSTIAATDGAMTAESELQMTDEIETVYLQQEQPEVALAMDETMALESVDSLSTTTPLESVEEIPTEATPTIDEPQTVAIAETELSTTRTPIREEVVFSPVASPVSPSMIKISQKPKPRPEFGTNQRAYAAFKQGQYDVAASIYRISLKESPDNRDALLGMAAINLKMGKDQAAYDLYRKVLKLNPKDPVARLSILNLQNQAGTNGSEGLLKSLIKDSPNNPSLYSTLGNLYSRQQRWPEAQQAYFEAYSRQSDNPDYAANLAISLDHMGQSKAALEYYQNALQLSRSHPPSFNVSTILARVDAIRLN